MSRFRYAVCLLLMLVNMVTIMTRSNVNIAIVSMIAPKPHVNTSAEVPAQCFVRNMTDAMTESHESHGETFTWCPNVQGAILGSFFWSHCVCIVAAGYLSGRFFGARWPVAVSLLGSAALTALGPVFAHVSAYLLVVARVLTGILQSFIGPATLVLIVAWMPQKERPTAMALTEVGSSMGNIVLSLASGFLISKYTWSSMFYMPAAASLACFFLVLLALRDHPAPEPSLPTKQQLEPITDGSHAEKMEQNEHQEAVSNDAVPWKAIMTNKAVLSLLFFKFGRSLVGQVVSSKIFCYFKNILNQDDVSIGVMFSLYTTFLLAAVLVSARLSEHMIQWRWLSRTNVRRLFSLFAGSMSAVALMVIPSLHCSCFAVKCLLFVVAVGQGCGMASDVALPPEMTNSFAALLYSMGSVASLLPGFIAPSYAGLLLSKIPDQWLAWSALFYSIGGLAVLANLFFLAFVRAEQQDFDFECRSRDKCQRTASVSSMYKDPVLMTSC